MKDRETGRSRGFGFVVRIAFSTIPPTLLHPECTLNSPLLVLHRPTVPPRRPTTPSPPWTDRTWTDVRSESTSLTNVPVEVVSFHSLVDFPIDQICPFALTLHALYQTVASLATKEVVDTAVARAATAARVDTVVDTAVSLVVTVARAATRRADSEVKVIINKAKL